MELNCASDLTPRLSKTSKRQIWARALFLTLKVTDSPSLDNRLMWPTSRATYRTEYISLNNKLIGQPSRQSWNCHQQTNEKWFNYRSSCINCALQNDEDVYWVSIGHYEAVAVGYWWYWVSVGHLCLYILHKVEIWTGVTDALLTHSLTDWQLWKIGLLSSLGNLSKTF